MVILRFCSAFKTFLDFLGFLRFLSVRLVLAEHPIIFLRMVDSDI